MDAWPLIEKIRQTGRLDHGSFGDEINSYYSDEPYPKGLHASAKYCADADRTNSWLFTDVQVEVIESKWETAEQEYRAKLRRDREREAERVAEVERLDKEWQLRKKKLAEEAEKRRQQDVEFDKAPPQPLAFGSLKSWLYTPPVKNPSLRFTDEEKAKMLEEARALARHLYGKT